MMAIAPDNHRLQRWMRQITDMRHAVRIERETDWHGAHARSIVSQRQNKILGWWVEAVADRSLSTTYGMSEILMGV